MKRRHSSGWFRDSGPGCGSVTMVGPCRRRPQFRRWPRGGGRGGAMAAARGPRGSCCRQRSGRATHCCLPSSMSFLLLRLPEATDSPTAPWILCSTDRGKPFPQNLPRVRYLHLKTLPAITQPPRKIPRKTFATTCAAAYRSVSYALLRRGRLR